ncbi:MAG: hypothetical protein FD168_854 [Desulfobulbaceae bacterium]|nr:MAG: hypothetical protein FD168_854 [Desulfobulbaceae bacterium]
MNKMMLGLAAGLLLIPTIGQADSLMPSAVTATMEVGQSITIPKTLTVSEEPGALAPVDVFFLADTTGSMWPTIGAVKTGAAQIMSDTAGLGAVHYAVGEYKDVGDSYVYRLNTDLTGNTTTVQNAINMWDASGGGDLPEANLFALETVAENTTWRADSTRIMVWFGDAPGHDPRLGSTEASATAALVDKGIVVEALDIGNLDGTGQATRIAAATGGDYFDGINVDNIVQTITDAITAIVNEYTTVALDLSMVPVGLSATVNPVSYIGDYDRSVERIFNFDVVLTADADGFYSFNIYGLVDGVRVATESDRITVTSVPEPATMLLFGTGLATLTGFIRRRRNQG